MAKGLTIEELTPDQPLAEGARRLVLTKFREAILFRAAVKLNNDIEAVHDMRVSLRRLWAAMRSFSNCFDHESEFDRLARKTRKLAGKLGAVRDLDVLIELFRARARQPGLTEAEAAALDYLTKHCLKRRDKRHKQLIEYLERLDQQQFEIEFQRFFTFDHDSNLSIATTG